MSMLPTTTEIARVLAILQDGEWHKAIDLADRIGLDGNRETKRRRIRAIVRQLRAVGARIEANFVDGCRLDTDPDPRQWRDYLANRQARAKKQIGETARRQRQTREIHQLPLFFPHPSPLTPSP